jgi:hypothetical protein
MGKWISDKREERKNSGAKCACKIKEKMERIGEICK